jgi:hypothetical protein
MYSRRITCPKIYVEVCEFCALAADSNEDEEIVIKTKSVVVGGRGASWL